MLKKSKVVEDSTLKFTASSVKILGTKKGNSVIQFTLTITFGADEAACTWRNCLCGIGKDGPWVMPSQSKYKTAVWNKALAGRIIQGFKDAGTLKQIEGHVWQEDESVQVEWGGK